MQQKEFIMHQPAKVYPVVIQEKHQQSPSSDNRVSREPVVQEADEQHARPDSAVHISEKSDDYTIESGYSTPVEVTEQPLSESDVTLNSMANARRLADGISRQQQPPKRTVAVQIETKYKLKRPEPEIILERRRNIQTQTMKQETKFPKETAYVDFGERCDSPDDDSIEVIAIREPGMFNSVDKPRAPIKFVAPEMDYKQPRTPSPPPTPPRIPTPPPPPPVVSIYRCVIFVQ